MPLYRPTSDGRCLFSLVIIRCLRLSVFYYVLSFLAKKMYNAKLNLFSDFSYFLGSHRLLSGAHVIWPVFIALGTHF